MATTLMIDVLHPHIHIKKEDTKEHDCRIMEITMEDKNIVMLHFLNQPDLDAFIGSLQLTQKGLNNDNN